MSGGAESSRRTPVAGPGARSDDARRRIFKAYDIRGLYGKELDEDLAERIGRATAIHLKARSLLVSRDMRTSSESLADAVIRGVRSAGCDVLDAGLISTDANYFAIAFYRQSGGVQVTASHNPPEYNGFKISREEAIPMSYETGLAEIERLSLGPQPSAAKRQGRIMQKDIVPDWASHVLKFARGIAPLTVAIDAANGMAGKMLPPVLKHLPIRPHCLYFELDGTFPHHEANPLKPENLADLQEVVRATKADLGAAYDGDADRCILVDETGAPVPSDLLTALFAGHLLRRHGPSAIVYDIRSSRVVAEEIRKYGGTPIRERVGHSFMKAALRRHNAIMGGELSGHFYWRENFFADSGVIAMIEALNIISETGQPLSRLLQPLRRYHATGEINFDVEDKAAKIEEIARAFSDGKQDRLDGLTVEYDRWWFNIRPSNTEPKLRLNLEAETAELMEAKKAEVIRVIRA